MMTALPLMLPAVAPLPTLAITTMPIVSFDAVLTEAVQQPALTDSVVPTKPAVHQVSLDAPNDITAIDSIVLEDAPITDLETEQPPATEAVKAAPAPELMVTAQIIAVAAQLASSSAKPTAARELPQQVSIAVGPKKTDAPDRPKSVNVAPVVAKPQSDPTPTDGPEPEIETVVQHASSASPNHRPAVELTTLPLPTIAAPANIQPQIFHELDLARDLAWIGNLAQDIVAASDDRDHLSFRLMPRSLGQLDVDLSRSPDGLRVEMTATTERATQIITAEQPRLIEELRQSGIKTAGTDLQTGQHPGSQRGHPPPRGDLPFFSAQSQPAKTTRRPDGRFA